MDSIEGRASGRRLFKKDQGNEVEFRSSAMTSRLFRNAAWVMATARLGPSTIKLLTYCTLRYNAEPELMVAVGLITGRQL